MIYLKKLNMVDSVKEYEFLRELKSENGFENNYSNISYDCFLKESIKERLESSQGLNLKDGYVPDTYFFLWDDDKIVGLFKVRHYLNEFLKNGAGHIGYSIGTNFRKKNYATIGLKLAIEELKKIMPEDEKEIYLSCFKSNIASLKVQQKNGAYINHMDELHFYTRIEI